MQVTANKLDRLTICASFFDNAAGGFLLFDEQLNLIDLNKSAMKLLGVRKRQVIGKNLAALSPVEKTNGRLERYFQVLKTGRSVRIKNVTTDTSTGRLKLEVRVFKAINGLGMVIVDYTEFDEVIQELNLLMYKLSHDMRSPSAAIQGLVNLAKVDAKDKTQLNQYLRLIRKEAKKLDSVLKQLDRTVMVRTGEEMISQILFEPFVKLIWKTISNTPGFEHVSLITHVRVDKNYYCNKFALTVLLQNIFENAVKYRKENAANSFIKIDISSEKKGVMIIIEDNGIGIDKPLHKKIFQMFYRATSQSNGSGLGLYTVKNCVKALRGQINLESTEGLGTKFLIYIPSKNLE